MNSSNLRLIVAALLLALTGILTGCATGGAAYRSGNYTEAARISADRLSHSPNAEKAREIFLVSYPQALSEWKVRVAAAESDESDPFRWERALRGYEVLQELSGKAALTPFGREGTVEIGNYYDRIEESRRQAVAAREAAGDRLMETGDLYAAREAYDHFERALVLARGNGRIEEKLDRALAMGTLWVGIDPVLAREHGINPSKLESALVEVLTQRPVDRFVAFGRSDELGDGAALHFLEVSIGEMGVERRESEVDQRAYHREIEIDRKRGDDGEVKLRHVDAKVFTRRKELLADCPARIRVFDTADDRMALERELDVKTAWAADWDVMVGDKRALGDEHFRWSEPPDPELSEVADGLAYQIAEDVRSVLVNYY